MHIQRISVFAITDLLTTFGGWDAKRLAHYEVEKNSKTVTLSTKAKVGLAYGI